MEGHANHVEQKRKLIKMVLEKSKHDASEYSLQGGLGVGGNKSYISDKQIIALSCQDHLLQSTLFSWYK